MTARVIDITPKCAWCEKHLKPRVRDGLDRYCGPKCGWAAQPDKVITGKQGTTA